jgi:integrase
MDFWIKAGRGLRCREYVSRKYGRRPDRYWCIRYKRGARYVTEAVGWWSAGITKAVCEGLLGEIRRNQRLGHGPQSLKELRLADQERCDAEDVAAESRRRRSITLGEFWEQEFLPRTRVHTVASTFKRGVSVMRSWLMALADKPLCDITVSDLENVVKSMIEKGRSPGSVDKVVRTFSVVWNTAKKLDLVSGDNPASKVKWPKRDNRRIRFLSETEASALLEALKRKQSANAYDAAVLSLYTGLRAKECTALTWADIDLDNGTIFVKNTKNKFNRHAFIGAEVREMLTRRYQGQAKNEPVFPGRDGGDPSCAISRAFHKTVEEVGLNYGLDDRRQEVVFHTLRHTFASWLVKRGHPLYTVAKLLGHRSITMTQRYAHLAPDTQRAAVSRLEGLLNFNETTRSSDEGK